MRRTLLIGTLFFLSHITLVGQQFGNEWINYGQDYFKLAVSQDGIYAIDYGQLSTALSAKGKSISGIDPRNIQLIQRGRECAIEVQGESDGSFDANDKILFYGRRNDGELDSAVYDVAEHQPNPYYNLHSDTACYFLTIGTTAGKRMQSAGEPITEPFESYHYARELKLIKETYQRGELLYNNFYRSSYGTAEGWGSKTIPTNQVATYTFALNNYKAGLDAKLECIVNGLGLEQTHTYAISVGTDASSTSLVDTWTTTTWGTKRDTTDVPASLMGSTVVVEIDNTTANGRFYVSALQMLYPQNTDMGGAQNKYFTLEEKAGNSSALSIANVASGTLFWDVDQPYNCRSIAYTLNGTNAEFQIDGTLNAKRIFAATTTLSTPLEVVDFTPYTPVLDAYLIITHSNLRKASSFYADPVAAYADYRRSVTGGGYEVIIADVNDLYNQFSYGEKSPLALRSFIYSMVKEPTSRAKYLFLMGKGQKTGGDFFSGATIRNDASQATIPSLVPSWGSPASDVALSQNLVFFDWSPTLATGRLSAYQPQQVEDYLNKVIEHENTPYDALYRKNLVHLSGGNTSGEKNYFKKLVAEWTTIAEGELLGGEVTTFYKSVSSTVELINISQEVNEGVSVVAFLGHSAVNVTDIEIGSVNDPVLGYNNKGKYPLIILNGCNIGDSFLDAVTFGEEWVQTPDKGAIAFLGQSDIGEAVTLKEYTKGVYKLLFQDSTYFSEGMGVIIQKNIEDIYYRLRSPIYETHIQQMTLEGDPVVNPFGAKKPDLYTYDDQLQLYPVNESSITAQSDSITLQVAVTNFARTNQNKFTIVVKRTLPDGKVIEYPPYFVDKVLRKDTFQLNLANQFANVAGLNKFEVTIDASGDVDELNESNNVGVIDYLVPSLGVRCLMPTNFSITNEKIVNLTIQATDLTVTDNAYYIEIDTSWQFNSAVKQTKNINSDVIAQWLDLNLFSSFSEQDTVTFYWRARLANTVGDTLFDQSSFTYIKDGFKGWGQMNVPQFFGDEMSTGMKIDTLSREWQFPLIHYPIHIRTVGGDTADGCNDLQLELNNVRVVNGCSCDWYGYEGVYMAVIDGATLGLKGYFNDEWDYRVYQCYYYPVHRFVNLAKPGPFSSAWFDGFSRVFDSLTVGDYVIMMSAGSGRYQDWSNHNTTVMPSIQAEGSTLINTLENTDPWLYIYRKDIGGILEIGPDLSSSIPRGKQIIDTALTIDMNLEIGTMRSPLIGPVAKWGTVNYHWFADQPTADSVRVNLWSYNLSGGNPELVYTDIPDGFDISHLDPLRYPNLKLEVVLKDSLAQTPPQMNYWMISYDEVAEGILEVQGTKEEIASIASREYIDGDSITVDFGFTNISTQSFLNPLVIEYRLVNNAGGVRIVYDTLDVTLGPQQSINQTLKMSTLGMAGKNALSIFVNPHSQAELDYSNNFTTFYNVEILPDERSPIIDVTFDGVRILDNDIVSSKPTIQVVLRDENKYQLLNDTANLTIFFKRDCDGCTYEQIPLSSPLIEYTFGDNESNEFVINFKPGTLEDGRYYLLVRGQDASGNKAGSKDYEISFRVINHAMISAFYPYPNPFTTSTKFAFTLTGSEVPDEIKIQIISVSGVVVREITQDELGPIHIGNNLTAYSWDGTDEYGGRLANGVYLYKVYAKKNGKEIDLFETAGDEHFKRGYGKIYILR